MIVPAEITTCVAFIGADFGGATPEVKGTGFFVGRSSTKLQNMGWTYLVTARHVIDNIAHNGGKVVLRVNVGDASEWIPCPGTWSTLSDNSVDVAVMPFDVVPPLDHRPYSLEGRVGHPSISHIWQPDVGDELFFPGLFAPHIGKKRNEPIVRTGHIAAMPKEKVAAMFAPSVRREIDAILIETRSIGGFSGSPVFYYTGAAMRGGGTMIGGSRFFLMGLMQGHFDVTAAAQDTVALDEARINMGIGIVVPVEQIVDTIDQFADSESDEEEAELARRAQLASDENAGTS